MSNYRRLISYIYAYEGGVKGKNIGFAKLEARNGQCRISVNVKKVYVGGSDMGVYLLSGKSELLLGKIFIRNGAGEFRAIVQADNVENSGIKMDDCYGLTVHEVENPWQSYTTIWEDAVAHAAEVELAQVTSQNRLNQGQESSENGNTSGDAPDHFLSVVEELEQEIAAESAESEARKDEEALAEAEEFSGRPADTDFEEAPVSESDVAPVLPEPEELGEPIFSKEMNSGPEPPKSRNFRNGAAARAMQEVRNLVSENIAASQALKPEEREEEPRQEQGINRSAFYQNHFLNRLTNMTANRYRSFLNGSNGMNDGDQAMEGESPAESVAGWPEPRAETNEQTPEAEQPRPQQQQSARQPVKAYDEPQEAKQDPPFESGPSTEPEQGAKACQEEAPPVIQGERPTVPVIGDPMQLKQLEQEEREQISHEQLWSYLKKIHTKIQAFDYKHGCEILTIKPQDIGILPRETWVYGNNSFLLHGYYNYRYLILAKLFSPEGEPRYLLGVPGHYYSNEKYMASMFGFMNFVLSKQQPAEDGRFGYWYTDIRLGI